MPKCNMVNKETAALHLVKRPLTGVCLIVRHRGGLLESCKKEPRPAAVAITCLAMLKHQLPALPQNQSDQSCFRLVDRYRAVQPFQPTEGDWLL